ncbi:MAG: ABC transporter ATP-binding protein [Candidatus Dojkabacteria bacterium]
MKDTAQKPTLVEASKIRKSFFVRTATIEVLHSVDLSIQQGEFLVIYGPSGCGKSTLLHIILGLELPSSGNIRFNRVDLYGSLSEDERANLRKKSIGMVYQQPNWIKSLTVYQNIMFALKLNGVSDNEAASRATDVLELVQMSDWSDYFPMELSSGQQQKVSLARAIVTDPEIIIADEPTGNLDYESGEELMKLLKELNEKGKTVVMVTHDLEYLKYAERAVQMFNGKIVEEIDNPKKKLSQFLTLKRGLDEKELANGSK